MFIPYQAQLAYGWTSLSIRINIVAVIAIIPAILWVTPRYCAVGAAWVWVFLNMCYLLIGVHFMYRKLLKMEKLAWYKNSLIQPFGAAAATALILNNVVRFESMSNFAQLIFLIGICGSVLIMTGLTSPIVRRNICSWIKCW